MEPSLRQIKWDDIRERVAAVNPRIAGLIDEIKPGDDYPLLIGRYSFGTKFVDEGKLFIPNDENKLVPSDHPSISTEIKNLLDYSTIPLCIWLNTTGEVFIEIEDRRIPLNVFYPGSICGLWETLDPPNSAFSKRAWSISTGAYTLFTLPKINDAANLKRLEKKYGFHLSNLPKTIFDQINLFGHIINSKIAQSDWSCEILFFTKAWVKDKTLDPKWLPLHYTLLNDEWAKSLYWRNKVTFDLIGQMFSVAQSYRNLRPSSYLIDTVMYLISIGIGASPGFEPVVTDENCAPIQFLQECLIEEYGLKTYIPTFMKANYLSMLELNKPVYYSLQIPTMLGSSPNLRKPHSVLDDLRMVKRLLESLKKTLEERKSPIFDLIKNVQYDFFHTESDEYSQIEKTDTMPLNDQRLVAYAGDDGRIFCETSSFFRGCVRITKVSE